MFQPDPDTFRRLARPGAVVPVVREIMADLETPVSAYLKLARDADHAFLLESVEGGESMAMYSYVGVDPRSVVTWSDGEASVSTSSPGAVEAATAVDADPLAVLRATCTGSALELGAMDRGELPRFLGGAVGFIGYEHATRWEPTVPLAAPAPDMDGVPDAVLMVCDTLLVFDHVRHRALVIACERFPPDVEVGEADADAAFADAAARIDEVVARLARPLPERAEVTDTGGVPRSGGVVAPTRANTEPARFLEAVEQAREHIAAGDVIQVVVSQRWSRDVAATPVEVYRALRMVNPSPYMYLLTVDGTSLVGTSPELLVSVHDGVVATHPIAGTRPRGATPQQDAELEDDLLADDKERAEHVMLVDLGRNDIGRVAEPGTVAVTDLMRVERFSHVMHLTSHVTGRLRSGLDATDALRACFPAGTVSGAPKVRAMQLIAELEPDRRGPYAGAVGYMGFDGVLDMAITIRTLVMRGSQASVQAGAGIVADSVPEREHEEARSKARAMLRALDVAEHIAAGSATPTSVAGSAVATAAGVAAT